jgi:hypothetical protein
LKVDVPVSDSAIAEKQPLLESFFVLWMVERLILRSLSCSTFYLTSIVQHGWLLDHAKQMFCDRERLRLVEKAVLLQLATRNPLSLKPDLNNQAVAPEVLVVLHVVYLTRYSRIPAGCSGECRRGQSSQDYFLLCLH